MGELVKLVCICGTRQWQTEVLMRLGHASSSIFKKSTFSRQQLIWSPSVTAVVDKTGIFTWSVCGSTLLRAHTSWLSLWIKSSCYRGICTCLMTGILANRASRRSISLMIGTRLFGKPRHKNPFSVCEMKSADLASIKSLKSHIVNRKVNTQVNWLEIRWIRVTKNQPFQFSYKYSHNALEAWKVVDLSCRTKGRQVDMGRIPFHAFMMAHAKSMTKNWRIFSCFLTISHQCFTVSTRSWVAVIGMMRLQRK